MVSKPAQARILVVDDNPRERLTLSTMISGFGYAVEAAEDGDEALQKLGSASVDAIVTDLMMPRVDGFASCASFSSAATSRPPSYSPDSAASIRQFPSCTISARFGFWKNRRRRPRLPPCSNARFAIKASSLKPNAYSVN